MAKKSPDKKEEKAETLDADNKDKTDGDSANSGRYSISLGSIGSISIRGNIMGSNETTKSS